MIMYSDFPSWITPEIIPGFPLRWYGLMYIIAFSITFILFSYQLKRSDVSMNQDDSISLFLWTILGLLVGSRIFATLIYDASGYYLTHPWMIFWPFKNGSFTGLQGMSYHGGVLGAVAGSYLYCRRKKLNYFQIADMITAGIPLGYTFGRLGNFINGELWGRVTTSPLGIVFPYAPRYSTQTSWVREIAGKLGMSLENTSQVNLPRHPSQLYEAAFEGVFLWLIIWFLLRNRKKFHGFILSLYLMGYGVVRFFIEYFREPDRDLGFIFAWGKESDPTALFLSPWNFSMGQLLNLLMAIGGLILFFLMKKISAKKEAERASLKKRNMQNRPPKKKKKKSRK
jgi:phosphatidylglycerol---prolipoprotein diacylglyceryl transferase